MKFQLADGFLRFDDGYLVVRFGETSGSIEFVENLVTGQILVDAPTPVPWRMRSQGSGHRWFTPRATFTTPNDPTPASFQYSVAPDGESANLTWITSEPGVRLEVRACAASGGGIELWPRVVVEVGARPPEALTYPILEAPKVLSQDGTCDRLVFPGHSGWLISSPQAVEALEARYPDGYAGASLQFMAYFTDAIGGFYVATHDPYSTAKHFRFSADEASVDHEAFDIRRGADLDLDYPVVLAPLSRGDWYEAADRYRDWVLVNAPWVTGHQGNATDPSRDGARWLFDEVGFSIWCTPARPDWSQFYQHYAEVAGTPLHIVPAWDWPATLPPSRGDVGVFPATFHPANVQAWEGHRVTPYLNDLFVSARAPEFEKRWEPNLLFPYVAFNWVPFAEPTTGWVDGEHPGPDPITTTNQDFFLCPTTEVQKELHAWRDSVLVSEYGMDGVFYDISSGNTWPWSRCLRADHGHPPGRGREIVQAYETLNALSKQAVLASTGRYLVQGTEVIQEPVMGSVDFYVSRACAGPMGSLETEVFGPETQPGGGRELIPLFQAVYHDVGPVHEDGWITLSEESGDLFYFIAARIALVWGGILSLQYSTEPPEAFSGMDLGTPTETILWDAARVTWDTFPVSSPGKEAFVKELAIARTTFGQPYLAYGKMLQPPTVESAAIELDFHQTFYGWGSEGWSNDGSWMVPSVMTSAWRGPAGEIGIVLLNLAAQGPVQVALRTDLGQMWSLERAGCAVEVMKSEGSESRGAVSPENRLEVDVALEPRKVTIVTIAPPA